MLSNLLRKKAVRFGQYAVAIFSLSPAAFANMSGDPDCNGNGVSDFIDLANGFSADCNSTEIPDECELADGTALDCNANMIPDECELTDYRLDDGYFSFQFGDIIPEDKPHWIVMNQFTVLEGAETINSISMSIAAFGVGFTIQLQIFDDPNNNGDPSDRVLLSEVNLPGNLGNGLYPKRFVIPPLMVGTPGDSFFIAMSKPEGLTVYVGGDSRDPQQRSWVGDEVYGFVLIEYGDFIIRADARHQDGLPLECQARGDANADGLVNVVDLLELLTQWGDCPGDPEPCPTDTNNDDVVNVNDLLTIISNWGSY